MQLLDVAEEAALDQRYANDLDAFARLVIATHVKRIATAGQQSAG